MGDIDNLLSLFLSYFKHMRYAKGLCISLLYKNICML